MRILIIGAVAGGTTAATQAIRNDSKAEIVIYEKDKDISYSGCSLPYYIGGLVKERKHIAPRDSEHFKKKYNVDVKVRHEVIDIDVENKNITVKNLETGEEFKDNYDELVIATGASPFVPVKEWLHKENVFTLRNVISADEIKEYILKNNPKKALLVGAGAINLELCENLQEYGIEVTVLEAQNQVMGPLDEDMALKLEEYLKEKGVIVYTGEKLSSMEGEKTAAKVITEKREIDTDMIILGMGVRPNTDLAQKAGVELGKTRAIHVNDRMQTNVPHIYAAGDCIEVYSLPHEDYVYRSLGSLANKTGRIAGKNATGEDITFKGILSTGIFKVFDMTVALVGMNEREAKGLNEKCKSHMFKMASKPSFMPGAGEMVIKMIIDEETDKILGVQIIGDDGVDKIIDIFATCMMFGAKYNKDLSGLDLAYAPPYSPSLSPVIQAGIIVEGSLGK
ncbi:FAD-dependent oxidoreductase [Clostridium peptidivorans]|uniref:FAD-dependent oxidoreductase n=1 Tax=Clostridium peptidivorans TaxID=100174 RepID=UPI000BE273E2|nr:FAD-dependent oxidoreductase [Clostridium peptidivorans]